MTSWFEFLIVAVILMVLLELVIAVYLWRQRVDREEWERRTRAQLVRNVIDDRRLARMHVIESDVGEIIRVIPIGQIRAGRVA